MSDDQRVIQELREMLDEAERELREERLARARDADELAVYRERYGTD